MVRCLCFSLFGHLVLSLGMVTVDTVYGKNAEARDEAVLIQRGSRFLLVGSRSGAHYLFPVGDWGDQSCILVTYDDWSLLVCSY